MSVRAQDDGAPDSPPPGRVGDYAGVLDAAVKERLENMLANLKERGGVEFVVVTVKSTGGGDIFPYLSQLSRRWKIGSMQSRESSLLLVVSTADGSYLSQASLGLRGKMPEGLLGDVSSRMRAPVSSGNYNEALVAAVQTFITRMAEAGGFSAEGIDQPPTAEKAAAETPKATDSLPGQSAESKPEATKEADAGTKAPATEEPSAKESAAKEPAAREPAAKETAAKEAGQKTAAGRPRSMKEVFAKETAAKAPLRDTPEKAELDALTKLPAAERVEKLKAYVEANPRSPLKELATEYLIRARVALGDEKLQAGDPVGGVEQFDLAIKELPEKMSDAFFLNVVSSIPVSLFLRGQRSTSFEAARLIEARVKDDPKRLLALARFALGVENADEAARLSEAAIALSPDLATAHQALGAARHIALRLDEAAAEYARALELDPKLGAARRALADLRRASGKTEDALSLYREQLAAEPSDKSARAGLILSMLETGKREDAEREMDAALKEDPKNMALLVGASYWYAANNEPRRAQELAARAIEIEPRYTWAHIALARALVALKQPLEAERALRFARTYGRFATMDYELASALAASGLYEEAGAELARSFTLKEGQIEARLAGRTPRRAATFTELLAPERRAGIFQATPADTEANARVLRGLLAFTTLLGPTSEGPLDAALLESAQQDFLSGDDGMRAFRQLYVADRLQQRGVEHRRVMELAEAAADGVEAALDTPQPTVAVTADELRGSRAGVVATGRVLAVQPILRSVLANIMRGRVEHLIGWALFGQGKAADAAAHLRRAVSVLPEGTSWWREAQWHLGVSLEAAGSQQDALAAYIRSYNPSVQNQVRRAVIESLYRKVNGSLQGLDAKIGPPPSASK